MKSAGITTGHTQTLALSANLVTTATVTHHAVNVQLASPANIEVEAAAAHQIGILLVPAVHQNRTAQV